MFCFARHRATEPRACLKLQISATTLSHPNLIPALLVLQQLSTTATPPACSYFLNPLPRTPDHPPITSFIQAIWWKPTPRPTSHLTLKNIPDPVAFSVCVRVSVCFPRFISRCATINMCRAVCGPAGSDELCSHNWCFIRAPGVAWFCCIAVVSR